MAQLFAVAAPEAWLDVDGATAPAFWTLSLRSPLTANRLDRPMSRTSCFDGARPPASLILSRRCGDRHAAEKQFPIRKHQAVTGRLTSGVALDNVTRVDDERHSWRSWAMNLRMT